MPEWTLKDDAEPQGSSDGFWYDINNGDVEPETVLADEAQLAKVKAAVATLASFEQAMQNAGLLNEF